MKIVTTTLALLLTGMQLCSAQKNGFSLTENNLSAYDYSSLNTYSSNTPHKDHSTNKYISIVPMIGYYRFPVSDIGYGIEIGYNSASRTYERSTNPATETITNEESLIKAKTMYLNLNVMERFHYRKYMFTASLTVPIAWTFKNEGSGSYQTMNTQTQEVTSGGVSNYQEPKSFKSGIYVKGGLHHLIFRNVYAGALIHLGIAGERYYGKRLQENRSTVNGPNNTDSRYEYEYKKYIRFYNDIGSSICLSYFF